jgi:hypothetical protein
MPIVVESCSIDQYQNWLDNMLAAA